MDPVPHARGRGLTLASSEGHYPSNSVVDRNATPRPSAQLQRLPSTEQPLHELVDDEPDISALAEDMSVLLRQRVVSGYGADAHRNVGLCEAALAEFWRWIAREILRFILRALPYSIANL